MQYHRGKSRGAVFWGIGITVALFLFAVMARYYLPPRHVEGTYKDIVKKSELISQLRINLLKSGEMEKNAVMAITDEESREFADQSLKASAAVEQKLKLLRSLIEAAPVPDEQKLSLEFNTCWAELRALDQTILQLAVQNTNLKAASLSREKGAEAMQRLEHALDDVMRATAGTPNEGQVNGLLYRAITAALKVYALHSPHIAEASDERMDQIEARMKAEESVAAKALDELDGLAVAESREALSRAKAAFAEFMEVTARVIALSRQNSNVKSLELSLGRKRKVAAQCDEILAAFQETVQNRTFKATR